MKCSKCNTTNIEGAVYCTECGTKLVINQPAPKKIKCKKCNNINSSEDKSCVKCGSKLSSRKIVTLCWFIFYILSTIIFYIFLPKAMKSTVTSFIAGYTIVFVFCILIPISLFVQIIAKIKIAKLNDDRQSLKINKIIFWILIVWFVCASIGLSAAIIGDHCSQVKGIESCNNSILCARGSLITCTPGEICVAPAAYPGGRCQAFFMDYSFLVIILIIFGVIALILPIFIFPILVLINFVSNKKSRK